MYLNYYKLNSKPFNISPDPKFLWLGEKHAEALASLKYGILEDKGFLLLTGEIGTGKTLLINCLLKSIIKDVVVATIPDPSLKLIDFYNILSSKFEMNKKFESKKNEKLLTILKASEKSGLTVWAIRNLIWRCYLEFVRFPGCRKMYVSLSDLDKLIEQNKRTFE